MIIKNVIEKNVFLQDIQSILQHVVYIFMQYSLICSYHYTKVGNMRRTLLAFPIYNNYFQYMYYRCTKINGNYF